MRNAVWTRSDVLVRHFDHGSTTDPIIQILYKLRVQSHDDTTPIPYFGLPTLDRIVHATRPTTTTKAASSLVPIIDLTSLTPGGGSTHLLYHLTTLAVLPQTYGGRQASVVVVDTDNTFSISRLAQQLRLYITQSHPESDSDLDQIILVSLTHIHVLRPQSLASTIAALRALPAYLFDPSKHHSVDRAIAFLALDSATAFLWQARAEAEAAAIANAFTNIYATYATLGQTLHSLSLTLACPLILTSLHIGPLPSSHIHSLRPSLPAALSSLPTVRLVVRRVPIRRFPAGISVDEARREAGDRQRAVDAGKFECVLNQWGIEEGMVRGLRDEEKGFGFRITPEGVMMGEDEHASSPDVQTDVDEGQS